jgi:C-terminal processing protease CtpA/Prc
MDSQDARMEELAAAPGVVLDLRGYPNGNHAVLQHLTDRNLESARWNVPQVVYPDRERIVGWNTSGRWDLPPLEPRFRGRTVFLTGPGAISYAESVMGIVEHYRLADIVGRPTAGTNGNVNIFHLPGGYRVSFTGMKVLKHDGSQHHLVGILPTVPVRRTIQAVRDGRDGDVEAALELIRGS